MLRINVYAEDRGWLFEDLKKHFQSLNQIHGFEVTISEQPLMTANIWVALRTMEAVKSPDLRRTVVCIHDVLFDDEMYRQNGSRGVVRDAGALVLSHPDQRTILAAEGISLEGIPILERPLGALKTFVPRRKLPACFNVGWIGRAHPRKRLGWFVQAMLELGLGPDQLQVTLIGSGLSDAAVALRANEVDCQLYDRDLHPISVYPQLYQNLDCVVITSTTEAGPLPLFEALATGLPVVSTPVGWARFFSRKAPRYVLLAGNPQEIAAQLKQLKVQREEIFASRFEIAGLVKQWSLDGWILAVLELAASLASGH
jgi:glycosyltransferase involved in cell wall biosynthesis